MNLNGLIINSKNVDVKDIYDSWSWLIPEIKKVVLVSKMGDVFLVGNDNRVYWLATDTGTSTKIADDIIEFELRLKNLDNVDNWFLPDLIENLKAAGKSLKDNEVYSFNQLPVLGGAYEVDNLEPTDISVHLTITGQICKKIKDLPDGVKVNIKIVE